jgi:hypothetical protein
VDDHLLVDLGEVVHVNLDLVSALEDVVNPLFGRRFAPGHGNDGPGSRFRRRAARTAREDTRERRDPATPMAHSKSLIRTSSGVFAASDE